ncbi:unnamed protein product [Prorocentrum cordatum]|uniref:Uncharacterized protein n=1 Tax=Prorocentrum cordatum TaxID=2364126 RepID=A0ABN9S9M4_9DINO|nr:unnamed protein product [Polarella glacialis]
MKTVALHLRLQRAPSAFTSTAAIVNGKGEPVSRLAVTEQPVFRCENHGAVLVGVSGAFRGGLRVNGSTLEFDADPANRTPNLRDVVAQRPESLEDYGLVDCQKGPRPPQP